MTASSNSVNDFGSTSITDPVILKIRAGLLQTQSLDVLRDSVFDAQQMHLDGEWPGELAGLLDTAKQRYLTEKKLHDVISEKLLSADTNTKKDGLRSLEDLDRQGKTDFYFKKTDTIRNLQDLLAETRSSLGIQAGNDPQESPADQTPLPVISPAPVDESPVTPAPVEEESVPDSVAILSEPEPLPQQEADRERARSMLGEAETLFSSRKMLDGFKKLIEAQSLFPALDGLKEMIESKRLPVMSALISELENQLSDVRDLAGEGSETRDMVLEQLDFVEMMIGEWPETGAVISAYDSTRRAAAETQIARLQGKKQECERLRARAENRPVPDYTPVAPVVPVVEATPVKPEPAPQPVVVVEEIDSTPVRAPEDPELIRLRGKLTNKTSLQTLKEGIEDAKRINNTRGLPQVFVDLLEDAQQRFTTETQIQGRIASNSIEGDYKKNHAALEELTKLQSDGDEDVYDPRTDTIRPIHIVIKEVRDNLHKNTIDFVQRTMTNVEMNIDRDPNTAESILIEALYKDKEKKIYQPLGDDNIATLLELEAKISRAKVHFEKARELVKEADRLLGSREYLKGFGQLIAAQAEFPGLDGLADKIDYHRERALGNLLSQIDREFPDEGIYACEKLANTWPETDDVRQKYVADRRQKADAQAKQIETRLDQLRRQSDSSPASEDTVTRAPVKDTSPLPDPVAESKPELTPEPEIVEETDNTPVRAPEDPELIRLRTKLTNKSSLQTLKEGIEDAKRISTTRGLPQIFVELLEAAQDQYTKETLTQGKVTTNSIEEDFKKNHAALEALTKMQSDGKEDVYDTRTDTIRPIQIVLKETRDNILKNTKAFVQRIQTNVEIAIARDPNTAESILTEAIYQDKEKKIYQPLGDDNIATLRALETDVQRAKSRYEKAVKLRKEADQLLDAKEWVDGYRKLIEAQSAFPGMDGLADSIDENREKCLTHLTIEINKHLKNAKQHETLDGSPDYDLAAKELEQCEVLAVSWPENREVREKYSPERRQKAEEVIRVLDDLLTECERLEKTFPVLAKDKKELDNLVDEFHRDLAKNETIYLAQNTLEKIRSDNRFSSLDSLLARLQVELDDRTGKKANLERARLYFDTKQWQLTVETCDKVLESATGDQKQQSISLKTKAQARLCIDDALAALDQNDIRKADQKFIEARQLDAESVTGYQEQLDRIKTAKTVGASFGSRMNRAAQDSSRLDVQSKVNALRVYLHIAGIQPIEGDEIPAFAESDVMLDARDKAEELREIIFKDFRDPLMKAFAKKSVTPPAADQKTFADTARVLRQQELLEGINELEAACWAETIYGESQEKNHIQNNRWDLVQRIWASLSEAYPETPEILRHLTEATLQITVQEFDRIMEHESPDLDAALSCLNAAETNLDLISRVEIKHRWAKYYELRKDYSRALRVLENRDDEKSAAIKQHLRVEELVHTAIAAANKARQDGFPPRALEILKRAIQDDLVKNDTRLNIEFLRVWNSQVDRIKEQVFEEGSRHTHDGDVGALEKILEIRRYEKIRDEGKSETWYSTQELVNRRDSIIELSEKKYRHVKNLYNDLISDSLISLDEAVNRLDDYSGQLVAIREAAMIVSTSLNKLQQSQLEGNITSISTLLREMGEFSDVLLSIQKYLNELESGQYWLKAATSSAADLENIKKRVDGSGVNCTREVKEFKDHYGAFIWAMEKIRSAISDIAIAGQDEKFSEVLRLIKNIRAIRADEIAPEWLSIDDERYQEILHWMDAKFVISRAVVADASAGRVIKGLNAIEEFCKSAVENFEKWTQLKKALDEKQKIIADVNRFCLFFTTTITSSIDPVSLRIDPNPWNIDDINRASDASAYCRDTNVDLPAFMKTNVVAIVGINSPAVPNLSNWHWVTVTTNEGKSVEVIYIKNATATPPLNLQKWNWIKLQELASNWLTEYETGTLGLLCMSTVSVQLKADLEGMKKYVEDRNRDADNRINTILKDITTEGGFPPETDIRKAITNKSSLLTLLQKAVKIGPETEAETMCLKRGITFYNRPEEQHRGGGILDIFKK